MKQVGKMLTVSLLSIAAMAQTGAATANLKVNPVTLSKAEDVGVSSERLKRIHDLIQGHLDAHDFAGAVTLVARKGKIVHFEAQGSADLESAKPMKTDSLFRVLAMTKPVTVVSVLMLAEEGKLILNDPVSKFIPEFKNPQVAVLNMPNDPSGAGLRLVPAAREITIQDLLTHTSGVANGLNGPAGDYVRRANLPREGSLDQRVRALAKLPLNFQPGTQWEYSQTTAYETLGRIVEIVSGTSLVDFFQTRIFNPLGMKNTFFEVPANRKADVASAYNKNGDRLVHRETGDELATGGAEALTGSTGDYFLFCQMLLSGGQLNGVRLLSRKSVELMTSQAIGTLDLRNYSGGDQQLKGYGFGLGVRVRRDTGDSGWLGSVGDYGWAGSIGTYFWIDPKEQLIGIIMAQTRNTRLRTEYPNVVYQAISD